MNAFLPIRRTAVGIALALVVTGCSDTLGQGEPTGSTDATGTTRTDAAASPDGQGGESSPPSPSPTASPSGVADWPTEPATADKFPDTVRGVPFAKGYTGAVYLHKLAEQWHIEMSDKKKDDLGKQGTEASGWYSSGSTGADGKKLSLLISWDRSGDLESLVCSAGEKAADHEKFLEDCAELDHPRSQPSQAAAWLDDMLPALDKSYRQNRKPVGSPLHRQGSSAFFLLAYNDGENGTVYRLRVFGTDA
ncbi:hypothetical protein [Streptomyces sp. JHA26]|uniref:hypothetical protein n=1 Tax=Streptomyces sp. JHA26 TaxID=1917143 RepID=UPI00098A85A5|nr:hypothetical protein [Streptomyces sp. JHA26]